MPKSRSLGIALLLLIWILFAFWQRAEHLYQCELIHDSLTSQASLLTSAVISDVQSHRWFGPFVQQQLPSSLDVLARSENVLALAVVVRTGTKEVFSAGNSDLIDFDLPIGEHARNDKLQVVKAFSMQNNPPLRGGLTDFSQVPEIMEFHAIVVVDRSDMLAQIYQEAKNRVLTFVLGTLVLGFAAVVWQFTVRLAQAEGRTRVLQTETRHLRELGQAAAGLAHQTRNPLGLIRGWTQRLVKAGLPSDDQQEQAEAILEECDRVTARINQFLDFARRGEVELEAVLVQDVVHELHALLQSDLDAACVVLDSTALNATRAVEADRDQLRQLLFNLLQNAIAHAPRGSSITITPIRGRHGQLRLEVIDQGPGVPEDIQDSLFEPYVTRRLGGTGLGLSIVRRIAAAHNWKVGYRSDAQSGSVFWIDGMRSQGE